MEKSKIVWTGKAKEVFEEIRQLAEVAPDLKVYILTK